MQRCVLAATGVFWKWASRVFLASQPCTTLASAHLALPATVLGAVEAPQWAMHTPLFPIAALRHCPHTRLERAWQRATHGGSRRCATSAEVLGGRRTAIFLLSIDASRKRYDFSFWRALSEWKRGGLNVTKLWRDIQLNVNVGRA